MEFFTFGMEPYYYPYSGNSEELVGSEKYFASPFHSYQKIDKIKSDFCKNLKESFLYQNTKILSKEVTDKGAREYHSFKSIHQYWEHFDSENLSKNNYHELFSASLNHCVFTGIFFDVDQYIKEEQSMLAERKAILKKVNLLIDEILKIIGKQRQECNIIIQDASSNAKISLHVLVKHPQLIFTSIYHIKVIMLEAVYAILTKRGTSFFNKSNGDDNIWLDFQVYRDNGTFRCLFNTKRTSPDRPLKMLEDQSITKESFENSLINVPYFWLNNEIIHDTLTNIRPKDEEDLDPSTKSCLDNLLNEAPWFMSHLDSMRVGLYDFGKTAGFLDFSKLVSSALLGTSVGSAIKSSMSSGLEYESDVNFCTCSDAISEAIFNELVKDGNITNKILEEKNLEEKSRNIFALKPIYKTQYPNIDTNIVTDCKNIQLLSEEECLRREGEPKANCLNVLLSECMTSLIFIYKSKNHYCAIKGGDHSNNHVYYGVELKKRVWWQGCFDEECAVKYQEELKLNNKNNNEKLHDDRDEIPSEFSANGGYGYRKGTSENPKSKTKNQPIPITKELERQISTYQALIIEAITGISIKDSKKMTHDPLSPPPPPPQKKSPAPQPTQATTGSSIEKPALINPNTNQLKNVNPLVNKQPAIHKNGELGNAPVAKPRKKRGISLINDIQDNGERMEIEIASGAPEPKKAKKQVVDPVDMNNLMLQLFG